MGCLSICVSAVILLRIVSVFAVNLCSPRRVFHRVFAVNLRALGGLSQYMRFSREPTVAGIFSALVCARGIFVRLVVYVCLLTYLLLFSSLFLFLFIFV